MKSLLLNTALLTLALLAMPGPDLLAQTGSVDSFDPAIDFDHEAVSITVQPDGAVLTGGTFATVGGATRRWFAKLSPTGVLDTTVGVFTGQVSSMIVQPDGKIVVAGDFNSVGGQSRNRIARLNANGTVENSTTFNIGTGASSTVEAVALQPDGKIIAAGSFANINGTPRVRIARLTSDGLVDPTFDPGVSADSTIRCLALQPDGKILIGGIFSHVNGQTRNSFARLNADGSLDTTGDFGTGTNVNGNVSSITVQPDGKILVSGQFNQFDGQPRSCIARLSPNGGLESQATFVATLGNAASSMCLQADGKLLVGGIFTYLGGELRNRVARMSANGELEGTATFNIGTGPDDDVLGLALQADGSILLAGSFHYINGTQRYGLARMRNDPATQSLTVPNSRRVQWLRGGTSPEAHRVVFEISTNGGSSYTPLGVGTRIAGGWELTGLSLPATGMIRGRATVLGGIHNGSWSILDAAVTFNVDPATLPPTLSAPASGAHAGHALSVSFNLPEPAAADSLKLTFSGAQTHVFTLHNALITAGAHAFTFDPANPTASAFIASGQPLSDGVYAVKLSYQDASGNAVAESTSSDAVTIDTVTVAPSLTAPAAGTATRSPLAVSFTLPESALPGSVTLTFQKGVQIGVLTLATSQETAGLHGFSFDPANPSASAAIASGNEIPDGMHTVWLSYRDAVGNTVASSASAAPVLVDTSAPSLIVPGPITVQAAGAAGTAVTFGVAATDQFDPAPELTVLPPSGSTFPIGATTVNVSAHDALGNLREASFTVTVQDTTAPTIGGIFAPLVITTGPAGTVALPDYRPQAASTDLVGVASLVEDPPPGSLRGAGQTTVTIVASDLAGNSISTDFVVLVTDGTSPGINAPPAGFTPATIVAGANGTALLPNYSAQPLTTDNVGVTSVTQAPAPGSAHPPGPVAVTLTAHDAAGNTGSLTFAVEVVDLAPPEIAAPASGFTPLALATGPNATAPLPDYTSQAVASDNVAVSSVTQSPAPGSPHPFGPVSVTLTAHDAAGNTAPLTFEVTMTDGTAPGISAPANGFTPLALTADASGMSTLPDFSGQAVTTDNVNVTGVTQVPAPGAQRLFGKTTVVLTAHDAAGNTASVNFDVFVNLAAPLLNTMAAGGGPVPGAGVDPRIPPGAVFTSLGLPAVDDGRRIAFLGKWQSSAGKESGIFAGDPAALLVKTGEDAPGVPGARFKSIDEPLLAPDGVVTFTAKVQGAGFKASNDEGIWTSSGGGLSLVMREGSPLPGFPAGMDLKSVLSFSVRNGEILALITLAKSKDFVSAADDTVLLRVTGAGASILLREGALVDLGDGSELSRVTAIHAFVPAPASPSHGRAHADGAVVARVALANKRAAIMRLLPGSATPVLSVGELVPALGATTFWSTLGLPSVETSGHSIALQAALKSPARPGVPSSVTSKNDAVLLFDTGDGAGFSIFAREGNSAPGSAGTTYSSFLDPLVNDQGDISFIAKVTGPGVNSRSNLGLWWGPPGAPQLTARLGGNAPDGTGSSTQGVWSKFISYALPDGDGAGPVILAALSGQDITSKNNTGIWAVDSTGVLRRLLRTGDVVAGKTVIGIHALSSVPGTLGASRGFNARGTVVARVLFAKGAQAIVRIDIPEGKARALSPTGE